MFGTHLLLSHDQDYTRFDEAASASVRKAVVSVIEGLMWCLAVLFALLGLLYYVDIRVAAMPRLKEPPLKPGESSATVSNVSATGVPAEGEGKLDA